MYLKKSFVTFLSILCTISPFSSHADKSFKKGHVIDIREWRQMKGKRDKKIVNELVNLWKDMINVEVKYRDYTTHPGEIVLVYPADSGGFGVKLFSVCKNQVIIKNELLGKKLNEAWKKFSNKRIRENNKSQNKQNFREVQSIIISSQSL